MIPPSFEYYAPTTAEEAIGLLQQLGPEAKILSGGMSLIPLMRLRLAAPRYLIDINRIAGLAEIKETDGFLRIGALAREAELERSALVRSKYPILVETAAVIGDPLVRNRATVGGNLAHADPANDHPATMLALAAEVVATGPTGERRIPIASFFTGFFATALDPTEILTEIRIPIPPSRSGGAYVKLERKIGDFATAGVAAQLTLGRDDVCDQVRIGLTNVGSMPIEAQQAEEVMRGKKIEPEVVRRAAQLAAEASDPSADLRGSVEYKRDLVRVLTIRALNRALEQARRGA
jgi:aerobic carbon-monoxide dehydrogenase medium subunit